MSPRLFVGCFDSELAYDLYEAYYIGRTEVLEELIAQIGFLVGSAFRVEMGWSFDEGDASAMMTDAIEQVYFCILEKAIPVKNLKTFVAYLRTTIRNALVSSIREMRPQEFECWERCADPAHAKLECQSDAEYWLYRQQVQKLALAAFWNDVRFRGIERKVCHFMASCFLGLVSMDPMSAQSVFGLNESRTKFLFYYSRMLLQNSIYMVKDIDDSLVSQRQGTEAY